MVASAYFRIKLIASGTSLVGKIQCIFHSTKNKQLTSFVEEPINSQNDCELIRAVICGKSRSNKYNNIEVNDQGIIKTEISGPLDSFGNLEVSQEIPIIQQQFNYDLLSINSDNIQYSDIFHKVVQTGTASLP